MTILLRKDVNGENDEFVTKVLNGYGENDEFIGKGIKWS
jgi:hypothetical protein